MSVALRSRTVCLPPIIGMTLAAERFMDPLAGPWLPANDQQRHFIDKILSGSQRKLGELPEVVSMASWSHEEVMAFLREHGAEEIALEPFDANTFGSAANFKLGVEWQYAGEDKWLQTPADKPYPGFRLSSGFQVFKTPVYPHPILKLETKNGDVLTAALATSDLAALPDFEFVRELEKLTAVKAGQSEHYDGVVMPQVKLKEVTSLDWMLQMFTTTSMRGTPEKATVVEARQITEFMLDRLGFEVKSTSAMATSLEMVMQTNDLVINAPFVVSVRRPGIEGLMFAAVVAEDSWLPTGR